MADAKPKASAIQHVIDAFARTDHNGNYLIDTDEARAGIVLITVILLDQGRLEMAKLPAPLEEAMFEYCKRSGIGSSDVLSALRAQLIQDLSSEFVHDLIEAANAINRDAQLDAASALEEATRANAERLKVNQPSLSTGLKPPSGGAKVR
ncbi:MAG: hypothetical protein AAFP04_12150 [Myxococcota bacterium]